MFEHFAIDLTHPHALQESEKRFQLAYDDLENNSSNPNFLQEVVERTFGEVNHKSYVQLVCHKAAREVASRIDSGKDGTKNNAYHNSLRFGKTIFNFMALATLHNANSRAVSRLDNEDLSKGILAATVQGFFHDGKSNVVDGVHYPFRLQQLAFDHAWESIAPSEKTAPIIKSSLSFIYGTDISGAEAPARIMRAWHDYYSQSGNRPAVAVPARLKTLVGSPMNTLIAALLHDAYLLPSALCSVEYEKEAILVAHEEQRRVTSEGKLFFLEAIMGGRMTTGVARSLTVAAIAQKIAQYREELKL